MRKVGLIFFIVVSLYTGSPVWAVDSPCPAEFNPDDHVWVLITVEKVGKAEFMVLREFFHQPDLMLRIVRKESSGCSGELLSFIVEGREVRTLKKMQNSGGSIFFLQLESGEWKAGAYIGPPGISGDSVVVILYDEAGTEIARRGFPIESLSHMTRDNNE